MEEQAKKFINNLADKVNNSDEKELENLYNKNFTISFDSECCEIPFGAGSFNQIVAAIERILESEGIEI